MQEKLGPKRAATRQRLLDAANARFREQGYESTTAAAIARDAGVTERTFFRYFPSKAEVLVTNWQLGRDAMLASLAANEQTDIAAVMRDALLSFAAHFAIDVESAVQLYMESAAFVPIAQALLELEQDLAVDIARRRARSSEDLDIRVVAYATIGLLRASIRAFVVDEASTSLAKVIDGGLDQLDGLYAALPAGKRPRRA